MSEQTYNLKQINKLKTLLYNRAWEKSDGDIRKYQKIKNEIRQKVKFTLVIEKEISLEKTLVSIVKGFADKHVE